MKNFDNTNVKFLVFLAWMMKYTYIILIGHLSLHVNHDYFMVIIQKVIAIRLILSQCKYMSLPCAVSRCLSGH